MQRSMEQIRASGQSLQQINVVVVESSGAARQIAASVRQQGAGTKQMLSAIGNFHGAMEQTVDRIKDAENAAGNLARIADRISEIIDVFEKKAPVAARR